MGLDSNEPVDSEDLFKIEWYYLPLLKRLHGSEPRVLEHKLASSPDFFCEVIAAAFHSEKEDRENETGISDDEKSIAHSAFELLYGWRIIPGTQIDGTFDGDRFTTWLNETKDLCKESGHFKIAMGQIGQVLAFASPDPEGLWIHKTIAEALNNKDVSDMRRGFTIGLFNKRGMHIFSYGEAEKQIAADYRIKTKALSDNGFFRIADAIRNLAEQYERDAEKDLRRGVFDDR